MFKEIIAFSSEIHTKHISTLRGQSVEFVSVTEDGTCTCNNHLSLKGLIQVEVPFTLRDTVVFPVSISINKNLNVKSNSNLSPKLKIPCNVKREMDSLDSDHI